ncbi:hypothetical protein RO3G_11359 [Rhizopus delemar RA 99-880]|uniref:Seipin n=1 Tax=Rhizopus delemar (strain RA 99-880 / ATCC MYA-4621 / FGSC 9543 / NRRL 43880) TaxID=246409 RepID=I1CDW8_RHIO9|nr:hypothetical protein RO3G_11359 [Rhizopus delemar RA 99-880]|eukprot:EIE86648.1 hypothetical protein RO3G_11359 [Rhizopus delemar RA 99-880]
MSSTDTDEYSDQSSNPALLPSHNDKEEPLRVKRYLSQRLFGILSPIFKIIFTPSAQRTYVKALASIILIISVLLSSFIAYVSFYRRYIPKRVHVEPIYFHYSKDALPQGHVYLPGHLLATDQAYDVSVQLYVPTSDINFNLGNFMVHLDLLLHNGSLLTTSSRPAILRYQSNPQRILRVLAKVVPLIIGWMDESQSINVPLIKGFVERKVMEEHNGSIE